MRLWLDRQRSDYLGESRFGERPHLLVGAVLDRMAGEHPAGVHAQGLALSLGRLSKTIRRHEHTWHTEVLQIDYVVHTARRA